MPWALQSVRLKAHSLWFSGFLNLWVEVFFEFDKYIVFRIVICCFVREMKDKYVLSNYLGPVQKATSLKGKKVWNHTFFVPEAWQQQRCFFYIPCISSWIKTCM